MSELILSIIIPVYNVELYLQKCLESVYDQNLNNFEVIAVNDGSTDSSLDLLEKFKYKNRNLSIINQENKGLSSARNTGLKASKGKYVYFLDSDDYLLPEVLKKMLDFIQFHNLEIAAFNAVNSDGKQYFSESIHIDGLNSGYEYSKILDEFDFSLPPAPVWLYLFNKEFLESNNIEFADGMLHEDVHFTLRCLKLTKKIGLLNFPVLFHRITRDGSITSNVTINHVNSMLYISRDIYQLLKSSNSIESIFYKKLFLTYINNAGKIINLHQRPGNIFTEQDSRIMKECLFDQYWIFHYILLKYNLFTIYKWYINDKNLILKKNIRRLSRITWIILNNKLDNKWSQ